MKEGDNTSAFLKSLLWLQTEGRSARRESGNDLLATKKSLKEPGEGMGLRWTMMGTLCSEVTR